MTQEMPDLNIEVLTVTLNRDTGRVILDYTGMNYLEAIGVLTVAMNLVQDTPYELSLESEYEDDEDG